MGSLASAARSDLCYRLQNRVTNSKRQNQEMKSGRRIRIKMEPRLLLKKSWNQGYQQVKEMDTKGENDQFQMESISLYG